MPTPSPATAQQLDKSGLKLTHTLTQKAHTHTHTMWHRHTGNLAALRPSSTSDDCQDKHNSSCEAQTRGCIIRPLFKAVTTSWTWSDHTRQHTHTHAQATDNPVSEVVFLRFLKQKMCQKRSTDNKNTPFSAITFLWRTQAIEFPLFTWPLL